MTASNEILPLGWAIYTNRKNGRVAKKQHYDVQVKQGLDRFQRRYNTVPKIAIMHPDTIKLEGVRATLNGVKIVPRDRVRKGDIFFCMNEKDFVKRS